MEQTLRYDERECIIVSMIKLFDSTYCNYKVVIGICDETLHAITIIEPDYPQKFQLVVNPSEPAI